MTNAPASCVAVLGTASDVGKSIVVTALCRIFSNMGLSVVPFKAQNMSNNSYVTINKFGISGEIGRAQVAQAEAARVEPTVEMNPVLLKPESDTGAQVVVRGKAMCNSDAMEYGNLADELKDVAANSLQQLREIYEVVVMEGAGSCAEMNLKSRDFVNFYSAHQGDAKVVLVADIDRGGVFAQVLGTLFLLSPEEKARVVGIIINRFRGDPNLFQDGVAFLEEHSGIPVLGVIPYIPNIGIACEDAVVLDTPTPEFDRAENANIRIAVIHLPHISNFTDFTPLEIHQSVSLQYIKGSASLKKYDVVILPGTKNVRADLLWLRKSGLASMITQHAALGKSVVGICGGYQMLGGSISDPSGVEGIPGSTTGLGLLGIETELMAHKKLKRRTGVALNGNFPVWGYEIHQGESTLIGTEKPMIRFSNERGCGSEKTSNSSEKMPFGSLVKNDLDGAVSCCGRIFGTYLHGIFDSADFTNGFLSTVQPGFSPAVSSTGPGASGAPGDAYDRLAQVVAEAVDIPRLATLAGISMLPRSFVEQNLYGSNQVDGVKNE